MKPFWADTKRALEQFVTAVPDSDYVSIVFFGKHASTEILPRPLDRLSRPSLINELQALPVPGSEKGSDEASFTDLGEGLDAIGRALKRPERNDLQYVFILSDMVHEPAPGTKYPLSESRWQALNARLAEITKGRQPDVFALLLKLGKDVGRDLPRLEHAFGKVTRVSADRTTLASWFHTQALLIERERLARVVERALRDGWSWQLEGTGPRYDLVLKSKSLPFTLRVDSAQLGAKRLLPSASTVVPVAPRGVARLSMLAATCDPGTPLWRRLVQTARSDATSKTFALWGVLTAEPASELSLVDVAPAQQLNVPKTLDAATMGCGTSLPLQVVLLLVCLLAVFTVWRVWARPAPIVSGAIRQVVMSINGNTVGTQKVSRANGRLVLVSSGSQGDLNFGSHEGLVIELRGRRPGPLLSPKRGVYARVVQGTADVVITRPKPGTRPLTTASPGERFRGHPLELNSRLPNGVLISIRLTR